jgi:hypothetical protein
MLILPEGSHHDHLKGKGYKQPREATVLMYAAAAGDEEGIE